MYGLKFTSKKFKIIYQKLRHDIIWRKVLCSDLQGSQILVTVLLLNAVWTFSPQETCEIEHRNKAY